ncbi:dihydrofolate reductase family protein [Sanguibacter sp. 25GB23B1]|uniref:dihydrofolate reductase family protein n=1 Tax=unclassified Sanguibacter TaxID=2645534 RepID=UPI0032B00756
MTDQTFPDLEVLLATGPGALGAPAGSRLRHSPDEPELCSLYAHPPAPDGRSALVRASMISTIDGAAWGDDGRSGSINGQADYRAFRVMRALADIVLVGAGTVRTERYVPLKVPRGLTAAREAAGRATHLHTAVVTRSGHLPEAMAGAAGDTAAQQPYVVTCEAGRRNLPASVPADRVVVSGDEQVDLADALDTLAARGFTRVLCEGGPTLLGSMLEADLVDEMCLTTSPQVLGGSAARPVITSDVLTDRPAARLAHLLHADGVLLARWTIRQTEPAPVV